MSKIILQKLTANNFMGAMGLEINFDPQTTFVYGNNGTGKSRLEDIFNWVLFGKNANGETEFLYQNDTDKEMHKVDHEASIHLLGNNMPVVLKRISRASVSKEGAITGFKTLLFRNDAPYKVGDYNNMINTMIREDIFKMLTNVMYFNNEKLVPKAKKREILIDMAGGFLSNEEVAVGNKDFKNLLVRLSEENKSIEDLTKQTKDQISRLKTEKENAEAEINALRKNMPEDKEWGVMEEEIAVKKKLIADIDTLISDQSNIINSITKSRQEQQLKLHTLQTELNNISFNERNRIEAEIRENAPKETKESEKKVLDTLTSHLVNAQKILTDLQAEEGRLKEELNSLSVKWQEENAKSAPEPDATNCPVCKQSLPKENIERQKNELLENWNKHLLSFKQALETKGREIQSKIKSNGDKTEEAKTNISNIETKITDLQAKIASMPDAPVQPNVDELLTKALSAHVVYNQNKVQIAEIEQELKKPIEVDEDKAKEIEAAKSEKEALQVDIDNLNKELGVKTTIDSNKATISKLEADCKDWSNKLADLEKTAHTILSFNRAKIASLEERINAKFQHVSFRMFKTLLNGETEDICDTVYDSKTYAALNTASKINAGLDIINALSKHYGISAPIFIDNRESITKIIPVEAQTIHMIVSEQDKTLRIV